MIHISWKVFNKLTKGSSYDSSTVFNLMTCVCCFLYLCSFTK